MDPKPKEIFTDPQHRYLDCIVADPDPQDPYVFGPPGSWSISTRYGSGSGSSCNQGKIVRKTLIPTVLWLLYDFSSLKNYLNVASKRREKKGHWRKYQDPESDSDPLVSNTAPLLAKPKEIFSGSADIDSRFLLLRGQGSGNGVPGGEPAAGAAKRNKYLRIRWHWLTVVVAGAGVGKQSAGSADIDSRFFSGRGRETECLVASLLPGRPYLFQVRAYNRAGVGPWSSPLEVISGNVSNLRPIRVRPLKTIRIRGHFRFINLDLKNFIFFNFCDVDTLLLDDFLPVIMQKCWKI